MCTNRQNFEVKIRHLVRTKGDFPVSQIESLPKWDPSLLRGEEKILESEFRG